MNKTRVIVEVAVGLLLALLVFTYFFNNSTVSAELVALKYPAQIRLAEKDAVVLVKELKNKAATSKSRENLSEPWYLLKITNNKGTMYYRFSQSGEITDIANRFPVKLSTEATAVLDNYLKKINETSPFGWLLTWDEVNEIFPRMAKARVRDLETGLSFNIQRRAGSLHADVQPLTAQDTKIFKEIYQGRWSWKRRAVILEKGEYKIAASMNGMPHGQGAIYGNNFPGHFCLHFYNSQTHSKNLDTAHQLMVWKAAGLVEDYLRDKTAMEKVEIALTALNENDPRLVILSYVLNDNLTTLLEYMQKIASLKIHSISEQEVDSKFIVKIEWYELGTGKKYKEEVELQVEKSEVGFLVRPDELSVILGNVNKRQ